MTPEALVDLLQLLENAGIEVWLDGGWAVDAVLGAQTRPHKDVDIILRVTDLSRLREILANRGFEVRNGGTESNFVLLDRSGLEVDVHAIVFDEEGNGVYRMANGADWIYRNSVLLIGTRNRGKGREIQDALKNLPLTLHTLEEYLGVSEPTESGASYEENAIIKARYYAHQTGLWALADDSGLEVDALNGAPGVTSARFGGVQKSDSERVALLLSKMSQTATGARDARFVCVAVIVAPDGGIIHIARGTCDGRIAVTPAGGGGFGFDPVFIPEGYDKTFAEMASVVKNRISHRAKALAATRDYLARLLAKEGS